ncbi:MAG: DUF262 domain-containing protein [Tannerella sp.]|jgi:hypothetical protein|nr:DUF262 domain-containing protein [Tannerella sp.]
MQKYSVNQQLIETVLAWVNGGEIAIPEIQRPFVWDSSKIRDLMDSLYQGYPVGYLITWKNPKVRLKDGSFSEGKKILIDGQQRITALSAAILGQYVINSEYERVKIKIAFNPVEEKFEVQNSAILKDKTWLPDISQVINGSILKIVREYLTLNPDIDENKIEHTISGLINIPKKQIGLIELSSELDIETVTEIFIRVNKEGVKLSQADFAMSKIASNTEYNGNEMRKAIDYFCHLAVAPEFYKNIIDNDNYFAKTDFFNSMKWLKDEKDDLYDPDYTDLIRVAFTSQFNRGRLSDLVSLLSGRNFETRRFEAEIAEKSFATLRKGVFNFISETNFKRFLMIIKSAGFISPKLIRSQNALNFAYIVYLKLKELRYPDTEIEHNVCRWFVYAILTGRYSGSPESYFDYDIKQISERPFSEIMREREEAELSDAYWNASLVQSLDTSVASSPYFLIFLASQVKDNNKGFLSKDILVRDLIEQRGDIHHLFPKDYLKKQELDRWKYNQIANYVYMQSEINIKVGNKPPEEYFKLIFNQIQSSNTLLSGISSGTELFDNLKQNCVPPEIIDMKIDEYQHFLSLRRKLMAEKIRHYYYSL